MIGISFEIPALYQERWESGCLPEDASLRLRMRSVDLDESVFLA